MSRLVPRVLSEAIEILLEWERVTAELRRTLAEGRIEQLASLLGQRQQIADRLDHLKSEHGLKKWSDLPGETDLDAIFNRLTLMEKETSREMEEKLLTLQEGIIQVHRAKRANTAYLRRRPQCYGAFLDTKK